MPETLATLTTAEVRDILKVSNTTLYELRKSKGFPAPLGYSRYRRYRAADVMNWLNQQGTTTSTAD